MFLLNFYGINYILKRTIEKHNRKVNTEVIQKVLLISVYQKFPPSNTLDRK